MSVGVGLGAFMDGFTRGYGIRRQMEQDKLDKANAAEDRKWREEQRTFERERMDYQREQMSDTRTNRQALRDIDTQGRQEFDSRVESGAAKPEQWDTFWKTYILPKRVNEYMKQGDFESAKKLQDWGESDAALKGGRLFSSALLKVQTGDHDGALHDVIEAGKLKGYIETGYELKGQDPIQDEAGNTIGYRLRISEDGGEEIEQDIAVEDLPRLISTFANPEAAWNTQLEAQKSKAKQDTEVETHRRKKEVDQEFKADPASDYRGAREERLKNDMDFADLSPEEQDRVVREDLAAAESYAASRGSAPAGAAAPTAGITPPKTIVDRQTGREVPVTPKDAAPGIGPGASAPAAAPARAQRSTPPAPRPMSRQDIINDAADHLAKQGNPDQIALRLMNAGIPENEWPEPLRHAVAARNAPQSQNGMQLAR